MSMELTELKHEALDFLKEPTRITAVVGTCSLDNIPYTATVYYWVDDEFNFYFLTATGTQKYLNLQANPQAAITIGFGPSYTTMQGGGPVELLEKNSEEEKVAIAHLKKRLQEHGNKTWPIFKLDDFADESMAVFKINTITLQLLNLEKENDLEVTSDDIQQIL
jgi:nitroimidazol reductase NimA-like FMN-containing flavoprotein (pyridoxamine 5'-phosphate oxidase superfamily)